MPINLTLLPSSPSQSDCLPARLPPLYNNTTRPSQNNAFTAFASPSLPLLSSPFPRGLSGRRRSSKLVVCTNPTFKPAEKRGEGYGGGPDSRLMKQSRSFVFNAGGRKTEKTCCGSYYVRDRRG